MTEPGLLTEIPMPENPVINQGDTVFVEGYGKDPFEVLDLIGEGDNEVAWLRHRRTGTLVRKPVENLSRLMPFTNVPKRGTTK